MAPERGPFVDLDLDAVPLLELAPQRVRLGEEDMRVEREDPGARLALEEHVEQDALLLLERAGKGHRGVQALQRRIDHLSGRERLDVGVPDQLRDAPLHRANGITHDETLCTGLAVVGQQSLCPTKDPTRFPMPAAPERLRPATHAKRCQTPFSVKTALSAISG